MVTPILGLVFAAASQTHAISVATEMRKANQRYYAVEPYPLDMPAFALKNPDHPELYSQSEYWWSDTMSDQYYPMWMNRAAVCDIHRDWRNALHAWRRAEETCLKTLRHEKDSDSSYHDPGFYGEPRTNLQEIRERIHWIENRDYSHWLLYRPYDFDVQVPPYELGRASRQ